MLNNYIKIALRNLLNNKVYSLINILGLTIGLAACLLVASVVINDLSYDRQWKHAKDIYRIISINNNKDVEEKRAISFSGLGPELKKQFPEVEDYCRMQVIKGGLKIGEDKDRIVLNVLSAEPSIWNMLDFTILKGNPKKFVKGYPNLIITEKIRRQYFPESDPVGKIIISAPSFGESESFLITGVIKDVPSNSHLRSEAILLKELDVSYNQLSKKVSGSLSPQYLLLKPGTSVTAFTKKVNSWYAKYIAEKTTNTYEFQAITDTYLRSDFEYQKVQGSIRNVYIFSGVAVLLLLIACINFINLTTARALKRVREVGIRKVLGAGKKELITQFLLESLLFFVISFLLAIVSYNLFIKSLEVYLGHQLTLTLSNNVYLFSVTCGFVLLVSLLTGLYPAWLISHQLPVTGLKGELSVNTNSSLLRKSLVVGQFAISIIILLATIIVQTQLHFINHKDLGYDKNNLLQLKFTSWGVNAAPFKQELLKLGAVENASITGWYPTNGGGNMTMEITDPANEGKMIKVNYITGDRDLPSTLKLQLQSGRMLNTKLTTDAVISDSLKKGVDALPPLLLTAHTARLFGVKNLDKPVEGIDGIPVGIVKDFHTESLRVGIARTIIQATSDQTNGYMLIRIKPASTHVLSSIHKLYQQFYPEKVFDFSWIENLLEDQYRTEQKQQHLFTFFSFLIVFLSCLGLLGLVTFTAEQRIKEIGIRKVLGASVVQIGTMLSKDFIGLVLIAILIASPIAWWVMSKWLQDFAYRIEIQWWMFGFAGTLAVLIAILTISFQAIKAALANPIKSLRTE